MIWPFKKKPVPIPKVTAETDFEFGAALLATFRDFAMLSDGKSLQQVCSYCGERGGFEMPHSPDCIVARAAYRLMANREKPPQGTA